MTDTAKIKSDLAEFVLDMLAKGFRQPDAHYTTKANEEGYIYVSWRAVDDRRDCGMSTMRMFGSDDFLKALSDARKWLSEEPTVEQRQMREFAEILAKAVEVGKQNGIDAVLVNPLEKAMRDLSKNALMHQPEAA